MTCLLPVTFGLLAHASEISLVAMHGAASVHATPSTESVPRKPRKRALTGRAVPALIVASSGVTMSSNLSLTESVQSVR